MVFSLGGGSGSTSSSSESRNVGFNESFSFSDALSQALSTSTAGSSQSVANQAVLDVLNARGVAAAGRAAEAVPLLQGQAAQLFTSGGRFLESLEGGAGTEFLEGRVSGESPVLREQIGALGEDIGRFFREEVNPAITSEAVAGGALGGGRQGVAQGEAAEAAGREFRHGATELRARDIAARDAAAGTLAQNRVAGAGTGLSSLPTLLDIARGGATADLDPVLALSQIIGGPTVLTDSFADSRSVSESVAQSLSEAFGFTFGESESTSSGRSRNFSFGF